MRYTNDSVNMKNRQTRQRPALTSRSKSKSKKGLIIGIILVVIIIVVVGIFYSNRGSWVCENGEWVMQGKTNKAQPEESCQGNTVSGLGQKPDEQMIELDSEKVAEGIDIRVKTPHVNSTVTSPIKITGEAKDWYAKDAFTVELINKTGEVLGEGTAKAVNKSEKGEYVEFEAKLKFKAGDAKSGDIIFYRSDPSGESKSIGTFSFPVFFE